MPAAIQRRIAASIVAATVVLLAASGLFFGQGPGKDDKAGDAPPVKAAGGPGRWNKAAPFPDPDEELYGVAAGGKMYVIGGWGGGKARGANYQFDPDNNQWTKKKSMPRPAHHAALAEVNGKIYVFGGFVPPEKAPLGFAWEPIENVWEYDPATDAWKALASLPGKRGAAVAVAVDGKVYL